MPRLSETTSQEPSGASAGTARDASPGGRLRFVLGLIALYGVHLLLLFAFMPLDRMTAEVAISGFGDYATHINQAALVSEGISEWGQSWVYDPHLIAGYPAGTLFDVDNKAWELWVHMGRKLGWSLVEGHNRYVLMAHLLVPAAVAFAARAFDLKPRAAIVAATLGTALWWFDSFVHWCWWAGMLAFTFAGYAFLIPLACFYRWSKRPGWGWALATATTLGLLHLIHPFAFFACVVPMLVLFVHKWKDINVVERSSVFGIAVVVLLMNAWWLTNAFSHWHYLVDSSHYGQSSFRFFFADIASLMVQPETTGMLGTRAGFRFLAWTLGLIGIWRWRREGDARGLVFGAGWISGFALTYFGGYLHATAQIQPYRFVMPISYLACLPAAVFLIDAVGELRERGRNTTLPWLAACLAFLGSMHLIRDMNYFLSARLPEPIPTFDGNNKYGAEGYLPPTDLSYSEFEPPQNIIDFVREHDDGQSRWLVDVSFVGEELAWQTRAQVMGGFTLRNVTHSWANYFRRYPQGISRPEVLSEYMKTFGIGWVMVGYPDSYLGRVQHPELELVHTIGAVRFYRPRFDTSLVEGGETQAKVEVGVNRIAVTGSDPKADLLLRFHWHEALRCRPDCSIERAPSDEVDMVGFMRIPAPHPADFEVYNAYEMSAGGQR